jgi:hypothetical protein
MCTHSCFFVYPPPEIQPVGLLLVELIPRLKSRI